jgi:hypothetical protein
MTTKQFVIACTFLFIIAHLFRRRKHMQKSLVWKGFLSESKWGDDYVNLSLFKKFVFWVSYPFYYFKFIQVVVWDRIDIICFRDSRTRSTKRRIELVEFDDSAAGTISILKYSLKDII